MNTGTYISAGGHGVLILWALMGGFLLRGDEPLPVASTQVSLLSVEEFEALSQPDTAPDVSEATPELSPSVEDVLPDVSATEDAVPEAPEPTEVVEPQIESAPEIDAAPDVIPVPEAADRVAPTPAPTPETDVAVADTVTPEVAPDVTPNAAVEIPSQSQDAAAPKAASTEFLTEAETPASAAPTVSRRPIVRPKIVAVEPEQVPEPEQDPITEAVAAAVAEASAPTGPPLTGGERDALRVAVQSCWNVGSLSSEALATTVVIAVTMDRNAKPQVGSIQMLSFTGGGVNAARQAYEAARRAIIRCGSGGYNLPSDKFSQWQEIEMTFNPNEMRKK